MDWFLYDRDFSHERIKFISDQCSFFIPPENHRNQTKAFRKFPEGIEREHGIKHFLKIFILYFTCSKEIFS